MSIYEAALRQNSRRRQNQRVGSKHCARIALPPPIKGLDTRSPVNLLSAEDAYELVNWVPDAGALRLREGSGVVTGATGPIKRVLAYSYLAQDVLLYVYVHSTNGPALVVFKTGISPALKLLNGTDLSVAMFNGYMVIVNGVNDPFLFYITSPNVGHFDDMALSGGNPSAWTGVKVFKNRLYFWGTDFGFWYLATNAIGGTPTFFPLYSVAQRGGSILSLNAWSVDGGAGVDDFLVVTTTKGEVIVYQGSDPSDPNDWAMVGRYQIGVPLGPRCFLELDGKLLVLTESDLEVLPEKFRRQQVTSKIGKAIRDNVNSFRQVGGYKLSYDSTNDRVLATVPVGPTKTDELVRTTLGFTRFTGINATDYCMVNNQLFHANGSNIYRQGGARDRSGNSSVADISFSAKTGYAMLAGGGEMRISAYRPKLRCQGAVNIDTALSFDQSGVYSPVQTRTDVSFGTPWGSPWGSPWSTAGVDRNDWIVGYGSGQSVSFSLSGSAKCALEWSGTDYEGVAGGMY